MKVRELAMLLIEHARPDDEVELDGAEYSNGEIDGITVFADRVEIVTGSAQYTSPEQEQRRIDRARKALEEEERRNQERKEKLREKLAGWGLTEADLPEAR